jgi:GNAT superfamily N-acetyltransferase
LNRSDVSSLLTFHYECLQGMYFSEHITRPDGDLLFSHQITDPYYNFFASNNDISTDLIEEVSRDFASHGRETALYITPLAKDQSLDASWTSWAKDAWMVLDIRSSKPETATAGSPTITIIDASRRKEYIDVFKRAYAGGDPNDPYGELDPSYTTALEMSFGHDLQNYRKYYLLAERHNKPVGVAALFTAGDLAGVYGVGTPPEYRKSGVGTAIMQSITKIAIADGVSQILLQTEAGSNVEHWYQTLGYQTVFTAEYMISQRRT